MTETVIEEMLATLVPFTATCRRAGCKNRNKPITVLVSATEPSAACGACALDGENTPITDLARA